MLGKENAADLYTKFLDNSTSDSHVNPLEYNFPKGRSIEAPQLHFLSQSMDERNYGEINEHCQWVKILIQNIGTSKSSGKHKKNYH